MKKPTPFGKYYLLERINVGSMAEVFRAKAFGVEGFERMVAVKRILPAVAEDREFIRTFIEEAKLAVQLGHGNIAQILDLGVFDGSYYVALEHVHGRDLGAMFERCRQLGEAMPIAQACFIVMKVCEGLDYAHNKCDQAGRELSLVHGDVSPQNILVSFEGEVKLIDFGLAKAAGAAASGQAGILKRKLGYRSPEQARGEPIDRKSDVFSCGVVLYELLTGERLFAGDSELATLEKVRSVEILPPSAYNRKIPGELERIVLKALSKSAQDRYRNAIDLHDELQAFAYTAGEFYSRKDLAAWLRRVFGKEIEEETARIDSYRQLGPPPTSAGAVPDAVHVQPPGRVPQRKPVQPVAVAKLAPARPAQSVASGRPRPASRPQPAPVVQSPPAASRPQPAPITQPMRVAELPPDAVPPDKPPRSLRPSRTGWDDDESETRVYDGDDPRSRSNRVALPLQPPVPSSSPVIPLPSDPGAPRHDLGSVAGGPRGAGGGGSPEAMQPIPGLGGHPNGVAAVPGRVPSGPIRVIDPNGPNAMAGAVGQRGSQKLQAPPPDPSASRRRERSVPPRAAAPTATSADPPTIPVTPFGARITAGRARRSPGRLALAIGGSALVAVVAFVIARPEKAKPIAPRPPAPAPAPAPAASLPETPDPGTGFDLYVTPPGITQWKLDGTPRTDRLPSHVRSISPGTHTVQIEPPPGFLGQSQKITVELGKAPRVDIVLQPISNIFGVFESTPPGATVSLIVDGKRQLIGPSPARAPIDPRSTYEVRFEKPGYVPVNRPIQLSGALEERVTVKLKKVAAPRSEPRLRRSTRPARENRSVE